MVMLSARSNKEKNIHELEIEGNLWRAYVFTWRVNNWIIFGNARIIDGVALSWCSCSSVSLIRWGLRFRARQIDSYENKNLSVKFDQDKPKKFLPFSKFLSCSQCSGVSSSSVAPFDAFLSLSSAVCSLSDGSNCSFANNTIWWLPLTSIWSFWSSPCAVVARKTWKINSRTHKIKLIVIDRFLTYVTHGRR